MTLAYKYTTEGTFTVTLTVYDAAGQSSTSSTSATITAAPRYYVYAEFELGHVVYGIDGYESLFQKVWKLTRK